MKKATAVNILLACCSTLLALLLLEGLAQLLPESVFGYEKTLQGDPLLGIPLTNVDIEKDFPETVKPADVYRIVLLGDSHMVSVRNEASCAEVLETLLNADKTVRSKVEVYNAGAPGHSHYQYYLTLKDRLLRYHPDLAIVAFYVGNDFLDLYRNDDRPALYFNGREFAHKDPEFFKYFAPRREGVIQSSRVFRLMRKFFQGTLAYQWSRTRVLWAVGREAGGGNRAAATYLYRTTRGYFVNQHIFRQSMNQILFLKSFPKEQAVINRVNRGVTELMKALADESGTRLLYVPIPTRLQIEPEADSVAIDKTLALCGLDRTALKVEDELRDALSALLGSHGMDVLQVEDALRDSARTRRLYDDTYHLNPAAHAIVGSVLYRKVRPLLTEEVGR